MSVDDALAVTRPFVDYLNDADTVQDVTDRMLLKWTGASFHVELLLHEPQPAFFYDNRISTSKNDAADTVTDRAITHLQDAVDVPVVGRHERQDDAITIDPSQTPSGKLNRVPLGSLHMADAETVDGVSVPLTTDELFDDGVLEMVQTYDPASVVRAMDALAENLYA